MVEPTAADLRIKFYEDQKKARMEYYKRVKENLGDFAKGVLDTKSAANAAVNSSLKPPAARVESTTTTTPMSPVRFEAPRGRQPMGTSSVVNQPTAATSGAFYNVYVATDGHTYLQGGTVTGGDGTKTFADIKVVDSGTGPVGGAGDHLYIEAVGDGVTSDGVLIPGWNLTPGSTSTGTNSTVPSNTLPTAASPDGKNCYIDLGVFTDTEFLSASVGNIAIYFCIGGYTVLRT